MSESTVSKADLTSLESKLVVKMLESKNELMFWMLMIWIAQALITIWFLALLNGK